MSFLRWKEPSKQAALTHTNSSVFSRDSRALSNRSFSLFAKGFQLFLFECSVSRLREPRQKVRIPIWGIGESKAAPTETADPPQAKVASWRRGPFSFRGLRLRSGSFFATGQVSPAIPVKFSSHVRCARAQGVKERFLERASATQVFLGPAREGRGGIRVRMREGTSCLGYIE